jgi:hypothetical protein
MQDDGADELHVVRDHVPHQLVTGHHDLGPEQATAGLADGGVGLGQQVGEGGGQLLLPPLLQLVEPGLEPLSLIRVGTPVLLGAHRLQLGLERTRALGEPVLEPLRLAFEFDFAQTGEAGLVPLDLLDDRLKPLPFPFEPRSEDRGHHLLDHHTPSKYSPSAAT